jgi:putative oxidoreductase
MKSTLREWGVLLARLIVGGILLYAGFLKAIGPTAEFAAAIEAYRLVPSAWLNPLSMGLPYLEIWTGLFLILGFYTRWGAWAASLLFVSFIGALGSALLRGIDLASCGCFGPEVFPPKITLVMDVALLGLSVLTARWARLPPFCSLDRLI